LLEYGINPSMPAQTRSQTLAQQLAKQFNSEFAALLYKDKLIEEGEDSTEKLKNMYQVFLCFNKYMPLIYKLKPSYVRLTKTAKQKTEELMQELQRVGYQYNHMEVTELDEIMEKTIQLCDCIINNLEPV
jgi:hypothetical protein